LALFGALLRRDVVRGDADHFVHACQRGFVLLMNPERKASPNHLRASSLDACLTALRFCIRSLANSIGSNDFDDFDVVSTVSDEVLPEGVSGGIALGLSTNNAMPR